MEFPSLHAYTEKGYDYAVFTVSCEQCGAPIFQFVHEQTFDQPYLDVSLRNYSPKYGPPMSARSWYKTMMRVVHVADNIHMLYPSENGVNNNQRGRARQMSNSEFQGWVANPETVAIARTITDSDQLCTGEMK